MRSLRVRLNNRDLLWTAPYPVAWLSWDLHTGLQEEHHAGLTVSGAIEVGPGEHDMLDWLVFHPLSSNDKLEFQITELPGAAPFVARRTAAQQEELRQHVLAAERSGELEAARIGPRVQRRQACSMLLAAPGRSPISATTTADIDLIRSEGLWSPEVKPDQWRISMATVPSKGVAHAASTYFWSAINEPIYVELGA
jgi:hypothetical protein